jgi:hypothetical protein
VQRTCEPRPQYITLRTGSRGTGPGASGLRKRPVTTSAPAIVSRPRWGTVKGRRGEGR